MLKVFMSKIFYCLIVLFLTTTFSIAAEIGPIKLRFKPSEQAVFEPIITESVKQILKHYNTYYGITLTRRVELIVSQDPIFIAKNTYEAHNRRFPLVDFEKRTKKLCKNSNKISGLAGTKAISICLKSPTAISKKWLQRNQKLLILILKHEIMHTFQNQLSKSNYYEKDSRPKKGPKWLVEGAAVYADSDYIMSKGNKTAELRNILEYSKRTKKPLSEFVEGGDLMASNGYPLAEFGAFLLIERFGMERMLAYWENLKYNGRWERIFKKTFGIKMKDFMNDVERLRLSQTEAQKWINLH